MTYRPLSVSLLLIIIIVLYSPTSFSAEKEAVQENTTAQEETQTEDTQKNEEAQEDEMCPVLDYVKRPSRVNIFEADIYGGNYLGDISLNSWGAGARGYYHFNHIFAMGVSYAYSPMRVDSASDFGRSVTDKDQHLVNIEMMINNEAAMAAGSYQLPLDLFLTLGAGSIYTNRDWKWLTTIGGGVKFYLEPKWLALRFDVTSYIHPITKPSNDEVINADMGFWFGLAFHFPYREYKPEI